MRELIRALGKKNAISLLEHLENRGETHFNEIVRVLATDPKTVSRRISELMEHGLVSKRVKGINSYYGLSKKGATVLSILKQLRNVQ